MSHLRFVFEWGNSAISYAALGNYIIEFRRHSIVNVYGVLNLFPYSWLQKGCFVGQLFVHASYSSAPSFPNDAHIASTQKSLTQMFLSRTSTWETLIYVDFSLSKCRGWGFALENEMPPFTLTVFGLSMYLGRFLAGGSFLCAVQLPILIRKLSFAGAIY